MIDPRSKRQRIIDTFNSNYIRVDRIKANFIIFLGIHRASIWVDSNYPDDLRCFVWHNGITQSASSMWLDTFGSDMPMSMALREAPRMPRVENMYPTVGITDSQLLRQRQRPNPVSVGRPPRIRQSEHSLFAAYRKIYLSVSTWLSA